MSILKRLISALPGGAKLAAKHSHWRRKRKLERIGDVRDRFTYIFEKNKWGSAESRSGVGSTVDATVSIRKALPGLVAKHSVRRLLDAPCGDYHWMQHIDWNVRVEYIGGDIVSELISDNKTAYSTPLVRFVELNIIEDKLPPADLMICRDCLIHFSYDDIWKTLRNLVRSDISLFLITDFPGIPGDVDIPTGHCRFLNFRASPFRLPEPLESISDPGDDQPEKRLSLWSKAQLLDALIASNKLGQI